jgi:hypothetical protein
MEERAIVGIRCQDIQTGLQHHSVNEFENLLKVGAAARVAIHLRGGDVVEYDRLKEIVNPLFGISKLELPAIIELLGDIEFVKVVSEGKTIKRIVPTVPYFDDLYETLGERAIALGLNELEQASVAILQELSKGPRRKSSLIKDLGLDGTVTAEVVRIGTAGSFLSEVPRSHEPLLITPVYFSENATEFADAVERFGEDSVRSALSLIRRFPGWPLKKILEDHSIGGTKLSREEMEIVRDVIAKGITQPPAVVTSHSGTQHFIFTPPIGSEQIKLVEKEIYEKAMAIIACVRQGEHFAQWRVRNPAQVLSALLRDGFLRATTIAKEQYAMLAVKKVCYLRKTREGWFEVHLKPTEENRSALRLAINMLRTYEIQEDRGLNKDARNLLFSGGEYTEYLRGLGRVRQKKELPRTPEGSAQLLDQILENIQKGA